MRSPSAAVIACALWGCGAEPVEEAEEAGPEDAVWTYEGDGFAPAWTAEDVVTALAAALAQPFPTPADYFDMFDAARTQGDELCPGLEGFLDEVPGCTSTSGWWWQGIAGDATEIRDEGTNAIHQRVLYADLQAEAPDGTRLATGGDIGQVTSRDAAIGAAASGMMEGLFIRTTEGSPFDPGVDALLTFGANNYEHNNWATLDGGITFAGGTLMFDAFSHGGDVCGPAPSGAIRIRDATEHWYTLDFGDDCDTCGHVLFNGSEDLGEACFDTTAFTAAFAEAVLR